MNTVDFFNTERLRNQSVYTHIVENKCALAHSHAFIEFFYLLQGKCRHTVNGSSYIAKQPGEYFLILPNNVHSIELLDNDDEPFIHRDILFEVEYFKKACDFFSPTLFDDFLKGKYAFKSTLSSEKIKELEKLVSYVPPTKNELENSLIVNFIISLIVENNMENIIYYPTWLNTFINMLTLPQNFGTDLSQILDKFNYSKEHMRRTFKKYTGMTMTEYFNNQKMNHAYFLLQTTDLTTEQICEKINIENIPYFYQLFKKTFGCTPHSIK